MLISSIINFVKSWVLKVRLISVIIVLFVSISLNIYLILGGGLKIDKSINTVNLQGQSQSTVIINGNPYSSDKIRWIRIATPLNKLNEMLESLTGFQVWNIKIIKKSIFSDDVVIFYPDIKEKK